MRRARKIVAIVAIAAAAAAVVGCGDGNTEPSIPSDDAQSLLDQLDEIQANIDQGSCFVASDRTTDFVNQVEDLPSDVDDNVKQALESGAANLQNLLADPDQCDAQTDTTTEETTTERPTTTQETTVETQTQPTQTQQTQTQPTTTTGSGGSGGVGPGGLESP